MEVLIMDEFGTNRYKFGRIASRQRRADVGGLERAGGLQDELLGAAGRLPWRWSGAQVLSDREEDGEK
jgi:hypothetical protein